MKHIFVFALVVLAVLCFAGAANASSAYTYIYASNFDSDTISVYSPGTLQKITDIPTDVKPSDVIVNPSGTYLYVAYDGAPYIDVFSTTDYSRHTRIRVSNNDTGYQYTRMSMNPEGTRLYVTVYGDASLYVVDITTNTVIGQKCFQVGGFLEGPYGVLYYNGYVYVSLFTSSIVYKLSATDLSISATYSGGPVSGPNTIILDDYNNRLLVANNNATTTIIELPAGGLGGVLNLTNNGGAFGGISVNSTGYVYRSNYAGNNITIFKPDKSILLNITGVPYPTGLVCDLSNNTVFVAASSQGRIYVINDTSILGYMSAGSTPYRVSIGTQAYPITHQVKFVVQSQFGIFKYEDVTISVYDSQGILQYSQQTDTSGQAAFYLQPTIKYTVWANKTSENINETMSVVPFDDTYYFKVWSFFTGWNPFGWIQNNNGTGGTWDVNKDIRMNYSVNLDDDPRVVLLNYSDVTASTTAINFTLLKWSQEDGNYSVYNTTLVTGSGMSFQQMPISVSAEDADGESYQIVVTGTTGAYGVVKRMDSYHFPGVAYPMPGLPTEWYPYIAFGVIVLFGLFFTYLSSGLGLIVMAFWGIVFMFMGWLAWSDTFLLLLQVLAIFGVGQIFKMKRQREGV